MKRLFLAAVLLGAISVTGGCATVEDIEIPIEGTPTVEPFAGPLVVPRLVMSEEALFLQGNTTGILGLYDLAFLIPASRKKVEGIAEREGASSLADYWRAGLEDRLLASGGFVEGGGPAVRISFRVTEARRDLTSLVWLIVAWIGNPITPLLGQPVCGAQVRLEVQCRVRAGEFQKDYAFSYDQESWYGLWWGRDEQRLGKALAVVADQLTQALEADLPTE